jgi:glutathione synthase/RimK-type ligase-like ATP-grasp enzyme
MQEGDVVLVQSREDLEPALRHFQQHGIEDALLQEHIEGEVIKFYGVCRKSYFKAFWAVTGEEATTQVGPLQGLAEEAARAVGIEVYGGDAVLTPEGELFLIDLNDWPSFSRCCGEAAVNIASYVMTEMAARR